METNQVVPQYRSSIFPPLLSQSALQFAYILRNWSHQLNVKSPSYSNHQLIRITETATKIQRQHPNKTGEGDLFPLTRCTISLIGFQFDFLLRQLRSSPPRLRPAPPRRLPSRSLLSRRLPSRCLPSRRPYLPDTGFLLYPTPRWIKQIKKKKTYLCKARRELLT